MEYAHDPHFSFAILILCNISIQILLPSNKFFCVISSLRQYTRNSLFCQDFYGEFSHRNPIFFNCFCKQDATAKSHDHSFEVLQKSKIGNFSVVTLRVATLKIPDLVFFAIHPKFLIGTFGSLV